MKEDEGNAVSGMRETLTVKPLQCLAFWSSVNRKADSATGVFKWSWVRCYDSLGEETDLCIERHVSFCHGLLLLAQTHMEGSVVEKKETLNGAWFLEFMFFRKMQPEAEL